MIKKRKYKKRKTKVKFYVYSGLRCQGRKELRFLKECVRYNRPLPIKPKRIKTPYGYYTPDFEYPDKYIEIKCKGTLLVSMGKLSYKGLSKISDKQFRKIVWVAKNIKPIQIVVYLSKDEYRLTEEFNYLNLIITYKGGKIKKS